MHEMHILTSENEQYFEGSFHAKNFENLLYDSVNLLYAAHDVDRENDDYDLERSYARGSMLSTLLLFECAANCCIEVLHLGSQFAGDVDKLPFLSKFELFLSKINGTVLDRGCKPVQSVSELKSLRDAYVHPKVKKLQPLQVQPHHYVVEDTATNVLGISRSPRAWCRDVALKSAKCADEFFNVYFVNWCNFDTNTVCSILLDTNAAKIPSNASFSIDMVGGLDRATGEFGLDFAYLGKDA